MPWRAVGLVASLATAGLVGACSDPSECLPFAAAGVEVELRDASTDQFVTGLVRGVVTDGAFEDSLRVVASLGPDPELPSTLAGAYERAGVYAVHLEGRGYEAWDTTNVRVSRDACHVRTVMFTARLTPAAP
jgi:hypothetical protein